jgi:N-acetylglucosamine kinase-like BadF-type ATPase
MLESVNKLIVDSGSTKSDWVFLGPDGRINLQTRGLNPVFHDVRTIENEIRSNEALVSLSTSVEEVWFYGAGCSSFERNEMMSTGLKSVFSGAKIHIAHDLLACAYATYEGVPAISCILGTGSNACFFDGKELSQAVPSLGYILGDEGSGSYFGKQLVSSFLYGRLPDDINESFKKWQNISKDEVISKVYREPNANAYLASFMEFAVKESSHPYIKEMMFEGFKRFNEIHVCSYDNFTQFKTSYVGSIAYLFSEELYRACKASEISIGKIIHKPIDGLIKYHQIYLNKIHS